MKYRDYTVLDNIADMMTENTPEGWLYISDENVRYVLGEPKENNILVFGINPSTATPLKLDSTINKVKKICAYQPKKYGWIMVNVYPLRSTHPNDLPMKRNLQISDNNVYILKNIVKAYNIDKIWAAWGDNIDIRGYLPEDLMRIFEALESEPKSRDIEWYHTGKLTRKGNPRHPLYLPLNSNFEIFYINDYFCEFDGLMPDYGLL